MVNCKNVCREIEEANYGDALTASTMAHLAGCGNCHRFYDERRKLRQLVASLEPVAAPADFDMRVRSRLASSQNGARASSLFANFTLGWPTLALAGLVLVIGVTLAFKVLNSPGNNNVAVQDESKSAVQSPKQEAPISVGNEVATNARSQPGEHEAGGSIQRPKQPKKRSQLSSVASLRNGRRLATQEFSSSATPVVRKEEAIASNESSPVFQIEASPQPLRLSLDYSSGVSRTISVPSLSFGSERVLTGNGSLVKSSSKGSW
jgi:hypothetical protein